MRVLLTSAASFVPPRGGSTRSNRAWLESLAWRGHTCRVVCGSAPADNQEQTEKLRAEAAGQGFAIDPGAPDAEMILPSGIHIFSHRDLARRRGILARSIRDFEPDWILVSSEDIAHTLLREADEAAPGRVVYLAHTPQFFPFGPESWNLDRFAALRIKRAAAVVTIGQHMAAYVLKHLGVAAHVLHPTIYGPGPWENLARFDAGDVLMINPCEVKGISIFAAVAAALPEIPFAALRGWGTTSDDQSRLENIPNVRILEPARDIHSILNRTRILLMPSLWFEGFGLVVMEAMLRGIPVVASDRGGLVEAKGNTGFILHVNPIVEYSAEYDEVHMPRPVVPPQNEAQWIDAVRMLATDRALYEAESERCRERALEFVQGLRASAFEEFLCRLRPASRLSAAQAETLRARLRVRN